MGIYVYMYISYIFHISNREDGMSKIKTEEQGGMENFLLLFICLLLVLHLEGKFNYTKLGALAPF